MDANSYPHTDDTQNTLGGFKTISLSDTTYRRLRAEKREGESFTEVIERLLAARQPPLSKHVGGWLPMSEEEYREIQAKLDQIRHGNPKR